MKLSSIDGGRRAKSNGVAYGIVFGIVTEDRAYVSVVRGKITNGSHLYSRHSSSTAPINFFVIRSAFVDGIASGGGREVGAPARERERREMIIK